MRWNQRLATGLGKALHGLRRTAEAPSAPRPSDRVEWVARLQTLAWEDENLVVGGWAFDRLLDYTGDPPLVAVRIEELEIPARVEVTPSPEPNLRSNGTETEGDLSYTVFLARIPLRDLGSARLDSSLTFGVTVGEGERRRSGPFTERNEAGSAGFLPARRVGDRWLAPRWSSGHGLRIGVEGQAPEVCGVRLASDGLVLDLSSPVSGVAIDGGGIDVDPTGAGLRLQAVALADPWLPSGRATRWDEKASDLAGRQPFGMAVLTGSGAPVRLSAADTLLSVAGTAISIESGPDGQCRVVTAKVQALLETVELEADDEGVVLLAAGRYAGDVGSLQVQLVGRRHVLTAPVELLPDGRWHARMDMLVSSWGQPPLPTATGAYRMRLIGADGEGVRITWAAGRLRGLPAGMWCPWFRLSTESGAGRVPVIRLNRPLKNSELGTYNQRELERRYAAGQFGSVDAVYLESFYERVATCNPRALDRVLARDRADLPRYWGVRDRSVAVPPGAIPVVDGTEEWWRARAACRWVITNDWLRARFVHQPHQVVLQTWHGTMFKRIGLDLQRTQGELVAKFLHERSLWDLLLSQNPHSTEVFKSAYAWDRECVEEGYPRNDLLVTSDGAAIRELLGIPAEKTVLLYAPTWRDDAPEFVSHLDVDALADELGDDYRVLLRAHSRTLRAERVDVGSRVLDVTTYPDITDLFLASDAIITDYSSIMFDFAVTGRPIIFFVPDLAEYRDKVRGVYFDLEAVAPGPVVDTQQQTLDAIRNLDRDRERFAARYAAWQQRFVPWDDGHSGERVLARMFAAAPRGDG